MARMENMEGFKERADGVCSIYRNGLSPINSDAILVIFMQFWCVVDHLASNYSRWIDARN